ncbi:hypothetical protein LPJ61_003441 [Coemansia biformis]|uniref:Uncharacterized protein n=1 Tax=Coemansia biformis TaxID=1286918 RepID=A0A9W8CY83_9FUNG|nr:hypothetical protein LPJ61_003441 [Coemansia biformis]
MPTMTALQAAALLLFAWPALATMPDNDSCDMPESSAPSNMSPDSTRVAVVSWAPAIMSTAWADPFLDTATPSAADTFGQTTTRDQRFRCLSRDGTSGLYEQLVGSKRAVSQCPVGTMCYDNPGGLVEIQCIDANGTAVAADTAFSPSGIDDGAESGSGTAGSSDDLEQMAAVSYSPTDSAFATDPQGFLRISMPTSSELRVVSLNVVMPTIEVVLTDSPGALHTPTVMVVAPDPSSRARLIAVPRTAQD